MLNTKMVKEYITKVSKLEEFAIASGFAKTKHIEMCSDDVLKASLKTKSWKRKGKKKLSGETRRLFEFSETNLWIPPSYRMTAIVPSTVCELSSFSVVLEVISDLKDDTILRYAILYIGEHIWSEDFITTYL